MKKLSLVVGMLTVSLLVGCQLSGSGGAGPVTPSGAVSASGVSTSTEEPTDIPLPTPEPASTLDFFATQTAQALTQPTVDTGPGGAIAAPTNTPFVPEPTHTAGPEEATTEEAAAATVPAGTTGSGTCPPTHVVQAGENLFRIAMRYGMSYGDLAAANGITNPDQISAGQELQIPACGGAAVPQAAGGEDIVHTVQPGENLFRIALRYGRTWTELAAYNGISNPDQIMAGQTVRIPQP
jgi:LysM repeat protein